jgi:predicted membrane protein
LTACIHSKPLFPTDTLQASFVGYQTDYEAVIEHESQEINFLIMKDIISLEEAVILPGENPAENIAPQNNCPQKIPQQRPP